MKEKSPKAKNPNKILQQKNPNKIPLRELELSCLDEVAGGTPVPTTGGTVFDFVPPVNVG